MSYRLFNFYMYGILRCVKKKCERRPMKLFKNDEEWNLPILGYADDVVLISETESNLRMMIE